MISWRQHGFLSRDNEISHFMVIFGYRLSEPMPSCVFLCDLTLYLLVMSNAGSSDSIQDFRGDATRSTGNTIPPTSSTQRAYYDDRSALNHNINPTMNMINQTNDIMTPQAPQFSQEPPGMVVMNNIATNDNNGQYTTNMVVQPQYSQSGEQGYTQPPFTTNTTGAYGMNSTMGLMNGTRSNEYDRGSHGSNEPPWVANIIQRLQQIEGHLGFQNDKWQAMDTTLQNQNARMTNIEQQITDLNSVKRNMSRMQMNVENLNAEVIHCSKKVDEYDQAIQMYSDMCDEIKSNQTTTNSLAYEIKSQMDQLQQSHDELVNRVTSAEGTIVDLQCRSMRDNLLFTGIEEPMLAQDETEDTERTLNQFLVQEMRIYHSIGFHRVHRLGAKDRDNDDPRPIIAKFERFKDREYVRSQAASTLRGKPYGVREQFPKVIEDKRKRLYPEAKRARAESKQNKVRMVRDRLWVNGYEYIPPPAPDKNSQQNQRQGNRAQRGRTFTPNTQENWRRDSNWQRDSKTYSSRVFERSKPGGLNTPTRHIDFASNNMYNVLAEQPVMERSESRKNKANSPLDTQMTNKKIL